MCVTTEEFISKNPVTLEKFLRSLSQTEEYIKDNKEEAQRMILENNKYISEEQIKDQWSTTDLSLILDDILMSDIENQAVWSVGNNLTKIKSIPDMKGLIYSKILKKIKPSGIYIDF